MPTWAQEIQSEAATSVNRDHGMEPTSQSLELHTNTYDALLGCQVTSQSVSELLQAISFAKEPSPEERLWKCR